MSAEPIAYTEAQVEALTGLRARTLQRWRWEGHGPRFVKCGRCIRYPAEDLRQWINSQPGGGDPPLAAA